MITRTEAERIAASIHHIRQDWPVASLTTLIERDLADWPLLDAYVGLAYIAIEQVGGKWVSQTPARVKELGPWRQIGLVNPADIAAREQAALARVARLDAIRARNQAAKNCPHCDPHGYTPGGRICHHDTADNASFHSLIADVRAQIRPVKVFDSEREAAAPCPAK